MASVTAPQTPAGRRIMKYLKKLEERSSRKNQRIGRMSKHIESKDRTIRRLRGQRDILRRVAQAPVKELQANDESGKEEPAYAKVVQDTVDSEKGKKMLNSALRRIKKLEKRFDQACAELEEEKNKNLYLQAQL